MLENEFEDFKLRMPICQAAQGEKWWYEKKLCLILHIFMANHQDVGCPPTQNDNMEKVKTVIGCYFLLSDLKSCGHPTKDDIERDTQVNFEIH